MLEVILTSKPSKDIKTKVLVVTKNTKLPQVYKNEAKQYDLSRRKAKW